MLYSNVHSKLDLEIDAEHRSPIHLGQIANSMYMYKLYEWDGVIAEKLGLTRVDVAAIKMQYPGQLRLQT